MEFKNLIINIVKLCQERRKSKQISDRITRGRAVSISTEFERKFAVLVEKFLPERYSILIDYPLTYKLDYMKRAKTSYPDIAIVRDNSVLVGIMELKVDLGFLRGGWIENSKANFDLLSKTKKVTYKTDIGPDRREKKELCVSHNLCMAVVLLTGVNDHGHLPGFLTQENCFVISHDVHPHDNNINEYNLENTFKKMFEDTKNQDNWERFVKFISDNFK